MTKLILWNKLLKLLKTYVKNLISKKIKQLEQLLLS